MAAVSLKRSIETDPHTVPGPLGLLSDRACGSVKTWKSNRLQMSLQCWSRFSVPALLQNTLDKKVSSFVAPFCFSLCLLWDSLSTAVVFPVVASLPPKNDVWSDWPTSKQKVLRHGNRFAARVRRRYFSEGEKRRPEIRLLFAGYYGTDKDYFGGVDRYLGQGLGRHPGRYIGRVSVDILYKIHDPILFL